MRESITTQPTHAALPLRTSHPTASTQALSGPVQSEQDAGACAQRRPKQHRRQCLQSDRISWLGTYFHKRRHSCGPLAYLKGMLAA